MGFHGFSMFLLWGKKGGLLLERLNTECLGSWQKSWKGIHQFFGKVFVWVFIELTVLTTWVVLVILLFMYVLVLCFFN